MKQKRGSGGSVTGLTLQLPTHYAPAKRAPKTQFREQVRALGHLPLLSQLYDAVPDPVMILNAQRQIVFGNAVLLQILNSDRDNFQGGETPGQILNCEHSDEEPFGCGTSEFCAMCGAAQAILSSLKGLETVKECRIVQKSGDALDLRVWATPFSMDGEPYSIIVIKDISSEKRRQVLERIFFHDLMNMVGAVWGSAELIKESSPAELAPLAEVAFNTSSRIVETIKAHRQLTTAENNELTVKPEPIDTLEPLRSIAFTCQLHEAAHERLIEIDPSAQRVNGVTDPSLLGRVIENLVKNALEAIKPGESVTLNCHKRGDIVEFTVHNPGYIPRHVRLQIFQRSFSTKAPNRGLGTYSTRLLTEKYLQGKVSFTSSKQHGTTFTAHYPLNVVGN